MDQIAERRQSLAATESLNWKNGALKRGSIFKVNYHNMFQQLYDVVESLCFLGSHLVLTFTCSLVAFVCFVSFVC